MKIFWSWRSDTPGKIGRYLVRDAMRDAIEELKQADEIEDATREALHLDQDIQGTTGSPDLVPTILEKIENSEVVVADVTIVGKTEEGDCLINSNAAIELGYALHACTNERVVLTFNEYYGGYEDLPFDLRHKGGAVVFNLAPEADREKISSARKVLADVTGDPTGEGAFCRRYTQARQTSGGSNGGRRQSAPRRLLLQRRYESGALRLLYSG
jgi:hypothetical protein